MEVVISDLPASKQRLHRSRYLEITCLTSTTSRGIILALKKVFACHGIPERVRSNNGPQYSSMEFVEFAKLYGFDHITNSPIFPQSNGQKNSPDIIDVWIKSC